MHTLICKNCRETIFANRSYITDEVKYVDCFGQVTCIGFDGKLKDHEPREQ